MITHSLVQKTVNAGIVGGTEKGKVRERKDKGWEKTWERGEKDERNRYKEWREGRREENERIERTERWGAWRRQRRGKKRNRRESIVGSYKHGWHNCRRSRKYPPCFWEGAAYGRKVVFEDRDDSRGAQISLGYREPPVPWEHSFCSV